jgi:hypothetical protein
MGQQSSRMNDYVSYFNFNPNDESTSQPLTKKMKHNVMKSLQSNPTQLSEA